MKVKTRFNNTVTDLEDYKTQVLIEAKKYQTVRHGGFPYRRLVMKLEKWDLTFGEFQSLMRRIEKLKMDYDRTI